MKGALKKKQERNPLLIYKEISRIISEAIPDRVSDVIYGMLLKRTSTFLREYLMERILGRRIAGEISEINR